MRFPLNAYALALGGALLASALALPVWRRWCVAVGLVDDPGHRKIHSTPIPLAGGLAVLTGMLMPVLAGLLVVKFGWLPEGLTGPVAHGFGRRGGELAAILAGAVGMVLLGVWDDKVELGAGAKFAGQALIALLVAAAGVRITIFVPSVAFSYAITVFWILTVINAFNFMDNMNGLCPGLGAIGAAGFAIIAAGHGQYLVALLALLTCGALLGFLPYNYPRATAFLGDAGSHLVGYLLAVLAILPHFYSAKHPQPLAVLSPLLVLAVPLADMAWVVGLRTRMGKPFYVGDTNHLSHRLVRRGLSKAAAVAVIWGLAVIAVAVAVAANW